MDEELLRVRITTDPVQRIAGTIVTVNGVAVPRVRAVYFAHPVGELAQVVLVLLPDEVEIEGEAAVSSTTEPIEMSIMGDAVRRWRMPPPS